MSSFSPLNRDGSRRGGNPALCFVRCLKLLRESDRGFRPDAESGSSGESVREKGLLSVGDAESGSSELPTVLLSMSVIMSRSSSEPAEVSRKVGSMFVR